jgi:DNA polymerase-1
LTCAVLADIEFVGMTLDKERVYEEWEKVQEERSRIEIELDKMCGGMNLNSKKQLGVFLYETLGFDPPKDHKGKVIKTKGGAISTKADHLVKLKPTTDEQVLFLKLYTRYNKLTALVNKNLAFFKGVVDERNCTFNAVFNQGIVQTHRLSSSGMPLLFGGHKKTKSVQFQNLPREYKRLFWSGDDEYLVGEADGAQLEFRVAADLGGDSTAYDEIANGADIHSVTARTLTDAGEPTDRQSAKSRTFRPLYGGSSGTAAEQAYCKFFAEKYKGISETQRGWTIQVLNTGKLRTSYGMVFYWPDTKMDSRSGYISNTTSIYNYPVQGFATGEIIPVALVSFWYKIRDLPIVIMSTVHDSIVAKVRKDHVELYKELSRTCFTMDVYEFLKNIYRYTFKVPLGCGLKVSCHWGDTKEEEKWNVFPDGNIKRL